MVQYSAHDLVDGIVNGGQELLLLAKVHASDQMGFDQPSNDVLDGVGLRSRRLLC